MEIDFDIFLDALIDATKDTLYLIPFLLITYIILESIEHKISSKTQKGIKRGGRLGPIIGSLLGCIPQCGFSASASALYAGRTITIGTLFAVYLSTSDEMLPVFFAGGLLINKILVILAIKLGIGMLAGFVIDAIISIKHPKPQKFKIHEICQREGCHCVQNCKTCNQDPHSVYDSYDQSLNSKCEQNTQVSQSKTNSNSSKNNTACLHNHSNSFLDIFKCATFHTIKIVLVIFIVTIILNLLILACGGPQIISDFASNNKELSVFAVCLIGLIPNCASSVLIADLYVQGALGSGACIGGLLVAAGIGLIVLIKTNRPRIQNFYIIITLYTIGVVCGLIISIFAG